MSRNRIGKIDGRFRTKKKGSNRSCNGVPTFDLYFARDENEICFWISYRIFWLVSISWCESRGMALFTCILTPTQVPLQAVVCYCHGYLDHPSLTRKRELSRLVQKGICVLMVEYAGHGRSDGTIGLISNWNDVVDDASDYFSQTIQRYFPNLPCFLMGESMGGAVAYCTYQRLPLLFHRGVVLVCPMAKISPDMLPCQWTIDLFRSLAGPKGKGTSLLGFLPIAPSKGGLFDEYSCKVLEKFQMQSAFPLEYGRKPRVATARELLDTTLYISNDLMNFDAPFLVQHGKEDRITDPKLSQAIFDESPSKDKTLKLYEGMWHSLIGGEPDENVEQVLNDSIEWILERSQKSPVVAFEALASREETVRPGIANSCIK